MTNWLLTKKLVKEVGGLNLKFPSRFQLSIFKFPCSRKFQKQKEAGKKILYKNFNAVLFRLARPLTLWPGRRRCQGCEELSPSHKNYRWVLWNSEMRYGSQRCRSEVQKAKKIVQFGRDILEKKCSSDGWLVAYYPSVWTACHQKSLLLSLCFWETDQCWLGLPTPKAKQWQTGFSECSLVSCVIFLEDFS